MSGRTYKQRRQERVDRLCRLKRFLEERLQANAARNPDRDHAQISALAWALEEIERFDHVETVMRDDAISPAGKLAALAAIVASRHEPSDADLQRNPGFARQYTLVPAVGDDE